MSDLFHPYQATVNIKGGVAVSMKRYSFEVLTSTQNWVEEHLSEIPNDGWLVVSAKEQTHGRGTGRRSWYSPPSANIYVTFATQLPVNVSAESAPTDSNQNQIPQIAALSVAQALEDLGFSPQLKWVNDILLNEKKVGGVLAKISGGHLLIGIGLNVNMNDELAENVESNCVGDPNCISVTSLFIETRKMYFIEGVLATLQQKIFYNIKRHFDNDPYLTQEVEARLTCQQGQIVSVREDNGNEIKGEFLGLNKRGGMKIQTDGQIRELVNGRLVLAIPTLLRDAKLE